MAFKDATDLVPSPLSRRSVIRAGVKLAYATPLVAASMRLGRRPSVRSAAMAAQSATPARARTASAFGRPSCLCAASAHADLR